MQTVKEKFIQFLEKKSKHKGSGKPASYAKAMEIIGMVLFKETFSNAISIWSLVTSENVNEMYRFIKDQQCNPDGIFKDFEPPSYAADGYCSAALKEFGAYLTEQKSFQLKPIISTGMSNTFNVAELIESLKRANLSFPNELSFRFISALQTKPFVILTGLSGSGKSKLAEAFSLWVTESSDQYCMVAVGADWTNREPLLGFPNALQKKLYEKPESGALDLILRASNDSSRPYFLILDEMNMSHVERYFADFLSAMESTDRSIALHACADDLKGSDELPNEPSDNSLKVPSKIELPKNLFIIGTVNIDETTYMFSPKVLDRANVIEFRVSDSEMETFLNESNEVDMNALRSKGASMGKSFIEGALEKEKSVDGLQDELMPFFEILQDAGAEFGYRTAYEISRFAAICMSLAENEMERANVIDAAIIQKLLPKLHGSRIKLEKILKELGKLCLKDPKNDSFQINDDKTDRFDIKYALSYEKLKRMHKRVTTDGFTSFAEA